MGEKKCKMCEVSNPKFCLYHLIRKGLGAFFTKAGMKSLDISIWLQDKIIEIQDKQEKRREENERKRLGKI